MKNMTEKWMKEPTKINIELYNGKGDGKGDGSLFKKRINWKNWTALFSK